MYKRQRNQRSNCHHLLDRQKSKRVSEKHLFLLYWLCQSLCVDHSKLWKILQEVEYQTTLPASWEICMQVKKRQLELDMEQQTGSKSGKEYIKGVYCHPAYLTYMQNTPCEMLDWMKLKLESRLPVEISITSDIQMIQPYGRNWRRNKEPLDESERGEWKSWLKKVPHCFHWFPICLLWSDGTRCHDLSFLNVQL